MVKPLHKAINHLVHGLVDDNPGDWESRIPLCESILRTVPLASLGGRSPYEVVMGIKPGLPAALIISTDEYVAWLSRYFKETYCKVEQGTS